MRFLVLLLAAALLTLPAQAANFSFTGNFSGGDDVQLFSFSLSSPTSVTLLTLSYAGGVNSAAAVIPDGGFDPILTLFDSTGAILTQNDDGSPPDVGVDPVTSQSYDSFLFELLAPGSYTLALTQFDNTAATSNLAGGFGSTTILGCSNGVFCDAQDANRTSAWAVDILSVDQASAAAVPEPASILMLGIGLVLAAGGLRKRRT
jgi:hypothetical protein